MAEQNASTIVFDGDSTGAVAALTAVDVAAKRAAASLQSTGAAIDGVGEGANIEKTTAKVKSLREAILRKGDAVLAEAQAYGEVDKAIQKIAQKKVKVELFTEQLGYLATSEKYLAQVQQKQKEVAAAESRQIAENAQWNALRLQKINEVKAAELEAIREVESANARKAAKDEAALNSYITRTRNAAVELQSAGKLPSERAAIYGKEFGLPSAEVLKQTTYLKGLEDQLAKTGGKYNEMGMTAKGTAAALRQVPAQFTDIVVSLQGGQAPLTVLLQQGGQLKDVFGGVGNAAKALGGYILGLVNPYTVAAAAVGTLVVAYEAGAAESREFNKALILSGNQAGVTSGQLMAMASSIDGISGTQGAAAEALALFAGSGKIGAENLEQFTLTAIRFEKVGGSAIGETVKKFEELRKAPLEATLKLNDSMGYLTQTIYDQLKALTDQGRVTEAAALAQSEFNKATASMATDMEKNLGIVERSWKFVTSAVKETWDAIKGIGRDAGLEGQVAAAQKMVDVRRQAANSIYGNESDRTKLSEAENQLKGYQELLKNQQLSAKYAAERTEQVKQGAEWDKTGAKYLSDAVKMEREIATARQLGLAAGKTEVELAQREADIRKSFEKTAKTTKTAREEVNKAAKEDIAAYKVMEALREKAKGDEMKRAEDSVAASEKARNAVLLSHAKEMETLSEKAQKLEDEVAMYGMSKESIELLTTARMLDRIEVLKGFDNSEEEIARIRELITERKRLATAGTAKDMLDENAKAAKEAAAEWKRTSDSINTTLTDALMRGFESGKDFARNLRDTVINMFKTLVLRPIISAVINPVAGALTGALGLSGAAQAASGGGVMDTVNSAGSFYNMINGGVTNAISSGFTKLASSSVGQSLGLSNSAAIAGNNPSAYVPAGGELTAFGQTASSYATAIGGTIAGYAMGSMARSMISGGYSMGNGMDTWQKVGIAAASAIGGPVLGAVAGAVSGVVNRAFGRKLKDSGLEGSFGGQEGFSGNNYKFMEGGWFRSDKTTTSTIDSGVQRDLANQFKGLQVSSALMAQTLGLSADSVSGFTANIKLSFKDLTEEQIDVKIKEEFGKVSDSLAKTILGSYKETVATVIDQIVTASGGAEGGDLSYSTAERQVKTSTYTPSEFAKDGETASQTLARLSTSLTLVNATSDLLGNALLAVGLKGANTASLLVDAFGGAESYAAQMGSYYTNFYTQEEQRAKLIENTSEAFSALGKTMPALDESARAVYRSMVEAAAGADLTVEANRTAYASLIALQGPMNELAPAFDSVATSAKEAAATMTSAWASVMQARGVAANDVTKFTAQASIDAAFTQFKKTDKFGIANAAQFQTITQADFASYSSDNQKLIATILTGFSDLAKANAPAVVDSAQTSYVQEAVANIDTSVADAIAAITKGLTEAGASLGIELLKAQGKTAEAAAAQKAIDTVGYTEAQVALYDYNQGIRDQITALNESTAIQARIATERKGLQDQYDALTMTAAELLTKQRDALDESNRGLFDNINALKAEAVAKDAATKATAEATAAADKLASAFTSAMSSIAGQQKSLQVQLLTAQGNTVGATALDRANQIAAAIPAGSTAEQAAAITAGLKANFDIQDQIAAANALAAANTAAAAAAEQAADAARQLKEAWSNLTDSLIDEVRKIRGEMLGGPASQAMLQAQFATTTAQARAGDQTAAGKLAGIADSLLAASRDNASTALDYARAQGQIAGSLVGTIGVIAKKNNLELPNDISQPVVKPSRFGRGRDDEMVNELRAMREEMAAMRKLNEQTAANTKATAKTLDYWNGDGMPTTTTS